MYRAPENGYSTKWELSEDPSKENWSSVVRRQFYLKARGGAIYGRLEMEFIAAYGEKTAIDLTCAINQQGSTNLEP